MRQNGKVSSKAEKNSNRAAKYYLYGKAILFGCIEISKRFTRGYEALDWFDKVQSGWRTKIYDAHIYYDRYANYSMVKCHDAYKFARAKKYYGIQEAINLAQEEAF